MASQDPEIRPIPGFDDYGASADGRIWRVTPRPARGRWHHLPVPYALTQFEINGHPAVGVPPRQWPALVGRLVALAWLAAPNSPSAKVRHLDGDRANCAASNLIWSGMASQLRKAA